MDCKINFNRKPIKWYINKKNFTKDGNKILNSLYDKYEYSGRFQMELDQNGIDSSVKDFVKGDEFSVSTVQGLINFHTHPLSCYLDEKTIWGWASGDDMREIIRFGLKGNLSHIIFTMEGSYVVQVNPCYLNILKNKHFKINDKLKGDKARGVIIYLIESYFKATHGHRTLAFNKKHFCTPNDWVKFANNFKLSNLFTNKNKCSKNIPCSGYPDYHFGKLKPTDYMTTYGTEDQFNLDNNGNPYHSNNDIIKIINENKIDILNRFKLNCTSKNFKWKRENWFKVNFFPNKFKLQNKYIKFDIWMNELKTANEIFSYWKKCKKGDIKFDKDNMVYIKFYPFNKFNCKLKNGKQILNWIKSHKKSNV